MRIGQLARIVGVSTRTIRHYHRVGLLPDAEREPNGYRTYSLDDVLRMLRIRRLAAAGMSLDEIADVLELPGAQHDLSEILAELDADLARQEEEIRDRRRRLAEIAASPDPSLRPPRSQQIADQLARLYGEHDAVARLEVSVMDLLTQQVPGAVPLYEQALADSDLADDATRIAGRFAALSARPQDDPEVEAVAHAVVELATSIQARPATAAAIPDTVGLTADDMDAVLASADGMSAAQSRCLRLVIDNARDGVR